MHIRLLTFAAVLLSLASDSVFGQKAELVVQTGHSDRVYSVAFSPDGKTLASASRDRTAKLWEMAASAELPAPSQKDMSELRLGEPFERQLVGGQTHSYQIKLVQGQYFRIVVEQKNIDVYLMLLDPAGKMIAASAAPTGPIGLEVVHGVTTVMGTYRLQIGSGSEEKGGGYRIEMDQLREAKAEDLKFVSAYRAVFDAQGFEVKNTREAATKAVEKYREAQKLFEELGQRVEAGHVVFLIGNAYAGLKETQKMFDAYGAALSLYQAAHYDAGEAFVLISLAHEYTTLDKPTTTLPHYGDSARDYYLQALPLIRGFGNQFLTAITLNNLGRNHQFQLSEPQKALDYLNEAIALFHVLEYREQEINTMEYLGGLLVAFGDAAKVKGGKKQALDYYLRAAAFYRDLQSPKKEASIIDRIGFLSNSHNDTILTVPFNVEEFQKALDYLNDAVARLHALGDREQENKTLEYVGGVLESFGDAAKSKGESKQALELYLKALSIYRDMHDPKREARMSQWIGFFLFGSQKDSVRPEQSKVEELALDYLNKALKIYQTVGDTESTEFLLVAIDEFKSLVSARHALKEGRLVYEQTVAGAAGSKQEQELLSSRVIGRMESALLNLKGEQEVLDPLRANLLNTLGLLYESKNEKRKALIKFKRAFTIFQRIGDPKGMAGRMLAFEHLARLNSSPDKAAGSENSQNQPELVIQNGHSDQVLIVAFSPDGKIIASGSRDGTIKLWDAHRDLLLRTLSGTGEKIQALKFSPDGSSLFSGGLVWNVRTARLTLNLTDSFVISPDSQIIASYEQRNEDPAAERDLTIKLFDPHTGNLVKRLAGHSAPIRQVAFSRDGKKLVSADDKNITLWDAQTGSAIRNFGSHSPHIDTLAFSGDDSVIIAGSSDGEVAMWEVGKGSPINSFKNRLLGVSPQGKMLALADGQSVKLVSAKTGALIQTLQKAPGKAELPGTENKPESKTEINPPKTKPAVTFSPDEKRLVFPQRTRSAKEFLGTIKEGEMQLWDIESGKLILSKDTSFVAFGARGTRLVSLSSTGEDSGEVNDSGQARFSGEIEIWDAQSGALVQKMHLQWGNESVPAYFIEELEMGLIAFSPEEKILTTAWDKDVKLWNSDTGKLIGIKKSSPTAGGAISFQGAGKMLVWSDNQTRMLWDVQSGDLVRSEILNANPKQRNQVSANGTFVLTVSKMPKGINLQDGRSGSVIRFFAGYGQNSEPFSNFTFSSSETRLVVRRIDGDFIDLFDTRSGRLIRSVPGRDGDFSSDDKTLIVTTANGFSLWETTAGASLKPAAQEIPYFPGRHMDISPNKKRMVLGDSGNRFEAYTLYDGETGKEIGSLSSGYIGAPTTFSADSRLIAEASAGASGANSSIDLWNTEDGVLINTLNGHTGDIFDLRFSPDGKTLASSSTDGTVKLWSVESQELLGSLLVLGEGNWLVVTPEGLFDGSPATWRQIMWGFNNDNLIYAPVEAFFREFFSPGLLQELTTGNKPKPPAKNLSAVDIRQPQVRFAKAADQALIEPASGKPLKLTKPISSRSIEIELEVTDNVKPSRPGLSPTSGAQDLRLFRNGSLVKLWPGNTFDQQSGCEQVAGTQNEPRRVVCNVTVPIVAGDNQFTAYVFNDHNVKSSDAPLEVTGVDNLKRKGILRILAVGVSQYANREYDLNYTTDDATSFASQLKIQQDKLGHYQPVEIKTLLNEKATKANILAELKQLAAGVQPEDAVVVYFSGHGKASGDHFYLVPHDLGYTGSRDQLSENGLKQILAHSISDLELEEAFRGVDAGQMFMIIDACNSGQALENKDEPRRGPMNTRGLAQLAYEKGMYILTASQNVEEAFVSMKLKHSYLTYALVEEGLKTKVADADHNGEVVLREWFDYALARVPKLREEVLQPKSLEEVTPKMKAARSQKSQTPRVFYRREPDARPLVVAKP